MLVSSRTTLFACALAFLLGCPTKGQTPAPVSPIMPPEEKASLPEDPSSPAPDPANELAKPTPQDAAAQAPQEIPASECSKPKDCKARGKPGKGMRWTCFETRCMAEPKGGLKKKKKRGKA